MRNKPLSFTLLSFILLAACSRPPEKFLITEWEKKVQSQVPKTRKFASEGKATCRKDLFTAALLKEEVESLEKKFESAEKIKGKWKHLDLASLPVPQALLLKQYGNSLGDQSVLSPVKTDYSSCKDVPCIYNKIYGQEDHVAGYVHYLWYLRLGHTLSADNLVPEQKSPYAGVYNGLKYPLSDYLYSENELYGFWRLSTMLEASHGKLKVMKEIQRVPRGAELENFESTACGAAYSDGRIIFSDQCLEIESNKDFGELYPSVIHEMSHIIDFQEGDKLHIDCRSEQQDYLDLIGMYSVEYMDENKDMIKEWKFQKSRVGPGVSDYADSTPAENFAETLAYFRIEGDRTQTTISPAHFQFVSNNYYQSRSFEKKVLFPKWLSSLEPEISHLSMLSVSDCQKSENAFCLEKKMQFVKDELKTQVSLKEAEACALFQNDEVIWNDLVKNAATPYFDEYVESLRVTPEILAQLEIFRTTLQDESFARRSFILCHQEAQKDQCFERDLKTNLLTEATKLDLKERRVRDLIESYLKAHPFSHIEKSTIEQYRLFVQSQSSMLLAKGEELWKSCEERRISDEMSPAGSFFTIDDGYMISSQYNCLNENLISSVHELVSQFIVSEIPVQSYEKTLMEEEVLSFINQQWRLIYEEKRKLERDEALKGFEEKKVRIKIKLESLPKPNCTSLGLNEISGSYRYHLKKELFHESILKICQEIVTSTTTLERKKQDLEKQILKLASDRVKHCAKTKPVKARKSCLFTYWGYLEVQALKPLEKDPQYTELAQSLYGKRTSLQKQSNL